MYAKIVNKFNSEEEVLGVDGMTQTWCLTHCRCQTLGLRGSHGVRFMTLNELPAGVRQDLSVQQG